MRTINRPSDVVASLGILFMVVNRGMHTSLCDLMDAGTHSFSKLEDLGMKTCRWEASCPWRLQIYLSWVFHRLQISSNIFGRRDHSEGVIWLCQLSWSATTFYSPGIFLWTKQNFLITCPDFLFHRYKPVHWHSLPTSGHPPPPSCRTILQARHPGCPWETRISQLAG